MEIRDVAGSGEPATQEENAGIVGMVKSVLEKHGYDTGGMSEDKAIALFNQLLEEQEKEYWLCPDCHKYHPRDWAHCDLPCVQYEQSRQTTEEEYERIYGLFDPDNYKDDNIYLQMPHTRLSQWLRKAERVYRAKKHLKTFDIHNGPNSPQREHRMTNEERESWITEIRAFMQEKPYRHKAWKDTTPSYRLLHPGNCELKEVIRVKTLKNSNNEKIVECVEYVRA